jgi:hypothetical protein
MMFTMGDSSGSDVEVFLHLLFRHDQGGDQSGDQSDFLTDVDGLMMQRSNTKSTENTNTCVCLCLVARLGLTGASYIRLRKESKRRRRFSLDNEEVRCKS